MSLPPRKAWMAASLLAARRLDGPVPRTCPGGTTLWERPVEADTWERWCRNEAGQPHGPYRKSTADKDLVTGSFDLGRPDGAWVTREALPNSQAEVHARYVLGVVDGTWTATDANGQPSWEHHFAMGVACGVWTHWDGAVLVAEVDHGSCDGIAPDDAPPPPTYAPVFAPSFTGSCPQPLV